MENAEQMQALDINFRRERVLFLAVFERAIDETVETKPKVIRQAAFMVQDGCINDSSCPRRHGKSISQIGMRAVRAEEQISSVSDLGNWSVARDAGKRASVQCQNVAALNYYDA